MWLRIDDGFVDHPKIFAAGARLGGRSGRARAIGIFLEGLSYSNRKYTDGWLILTAIRTFSVDKHPLKVAEVLAAVGLWEKGEGGYQIHDYQDFNPLSADRLRKQRARAVSEIDTGQDQDSTRARGTPSRPPTSTTVYLDPPLPPLLPLRAQFERWWVSYPKKVGKDAAWTVWKRIYPADDLADQMIEKLAEQKASHDWRKENGQFIPHPRTWLNQGRWKDEPSTATISEKPSWCDHSPRCHSVAGHGLALEIEKECQHQPRCQTFAEHRGR